MPGARYKRHPQAGHETCGRDAEMPVDSIFNYALIVIVAAVTCYFRALSGASCFMAGEIAIGSTP